MDREELQRAVQKVTQRLHHPVPQQLEILLQKLHPPTSSIQKIALPTMEGLQMVAVDSIIKTRPGTSKNSPPERRLKIHPDAV